MKENSGLKKIFNNVLVILFLSAMGGMVYFSQTNPPACVFIVGAVFFFLGTLGIFTNGLNLENGFLLIFPFAGAIVMLISASFIWDFSFLEKIRKNIDQMIPIAFMASFFCIGIGMFFGSILYRKKKIENCTCIVQAQCIDLREDPGEQLYSPVYKYYYNGREYIYESNFSSNAKPPVLNGYYEIKINPQHPEDAWIPVHSVTVTILGIIFMVISVLVAFCWLKQNVAF